MSPCGAETGQPGTRPSLSYQLAPGAVQEDCVFLSNYSNVPLTFTVYGTDAFNNRTGDFAVLEGDDPPTDVGSWIKLGTEAVTLQPSTGIEMPLTIQVPANASPGDHVGAVLASSRTSADDATGKQVLLDRRTGTRVYFRVAGEENPGLVVEDLSVDYHGSLNPLHGEVDVTYTVRNEGNIRLGAKQEVTVNDLFGAAATKKPRPIAELLPGNAVTFREHFTGIAATFRLSADVKLTPFAPVGAEGDVPEADHDDRARLGHPVAPDRAPRDPRRGDLLRASSSKPNARRRRATPADGSRPDRRAGDGRHPRTGERRAIAHAHAAARRIVGPARGARAPVSARWVLFAFVVGGAAVLPMHSCGHATAAPVEPSVDVGPASGELGELVLVTHAQLAQGAGHLRCVWQPRAAVAHRTASCGACTWSTFPRAGRYRYASRW